MDLIGLTVVGGATVLLLVLARFRRGFFAHYREIPGLSRLLRAFGLSVEDGKRLMVALGSQSLLTRNAGAALAGLGLLRAVSAKAAVSDRPPVAVTGDPAVALLAQASIHSAFRAAGATEFFQPVSGRLTGLTPFSSAAASMPILHDEGVSVAVLLGQFGPEAALLADAANRSEALLIGGTGDLAGQSVLYATASELLLGEELFAAPALTGGSPASSASLAVQDVLRWAAVLGLIIGVALKLLGII